MAHEEHKDERHHPFAQQRVDFAYLSYHDVANVAKGLAEQFYGTAPRYSYFDGCSQGGHEALGEIQRYPTDFNGVLAAPPRRS